MATELSRRQFLKIGGGGFWASTWARVAGFGSTRWRRPPSPAEPSMLPADTAPSTSTPLLIPPVMPKAGTIKLKNGKTPTTTRSR